MKFRRINKNTINCIITSDEMQAHGVGIDDIFEKKEQGMDFLRQILNEAARKLDFHASGTVTSMQLSVLPDKSLSLTISEQNDKSVEDMVRNLRKKLGIVINEKMRKELAKLPQEERLKRLADYAARFIEKELTDSVVDGIGAVVDENGTSSNGISRTTADGNN
ncbi:MAG: adaptor protein MecA [Saccharofermentanales bacterium]